MTKLAAQKIGSILDYAAESDIDSSKSKPATDKSKLINREEGNAAVFDRHVDIFLECIQTAAASPGNSFVALKVTSLSSPQLLQRLSTSLNKLHALYDRFHEGGSSVLGADYLQKISKEDAHKIPESYVADWKLSRLGWNATLDASHLPALLPYVQHLGEDEIKAVQEACLAEEELGEVRQLQERMRRVGEAARRQGVKLLVDAEHTYFQPAIDYVTKQLMREFNRESWIVFNTYQAYLKDTPDRMRAHMEQAKAEGYRFAVKLVRGAYLELERRKAAEEGRASPVWDRIQETHACYNSCMQNLLSAAQREEAQVLLGTHNQESVELAAEMMCKQHMAPKRSGVYFAQLLGMSDHLTYGLAEAGYDAFKYIPYGPIEEVMPYLLRRANENKDVLRGSRKDVELLKREMRRRVAAVGYAPTPRSRTLHSAS